MVLLSMAGTNRAIAQCGNATWVERNPEIPPGYMSGHVMAYDSARDVTVLFGAGSNAPVDNQTWEWNGTTWTLRAPVTSPPAAGYQVMAYDSARSVCVLFGEQGTWEYNGVNWVQKTSALNPFGGGASMAYDAGRGVCVLLEEHDYGIPVVWEWNGTEWMWFFPEHQPSLRDRAGMAYDAVRQEIVLFGGFDENGFNQETWIYNGIDWTQETPFVVPQGRRDPAMSFDSARGVVVMQGGDYGGGSYSDVWEWNGSGWAEPDPLPGIVPTGMVTPRMVFDNLRHVSVLVGGSETWEWNGAAWTLRSQVHVSPGRALWNALDYDIVRQKTVLFGGLSPGVLTMEGSNETWEWDGAVWVQRSPATSPLKRYHHAMEYDSTRGVSVLYGGYNGGLGVQRDTWEWNGTDWLLRAAVSAPGYRSNHGLAFDSQRNVTVMFGGYDGNPLPNNQTWEWNGTTWTQRNPAISPSPRVDFAMAYDSDRHVTVLFAGYLGDNPASMYGDTWEWDGVNWTQRTPGTAPAARSGAKMVYDTNQNKMVLFGGVTNPISGDALDDTWTWNGTNWALLTPAHTPSQRDAFELAFDSVRGVTVLHGGACDCFQMSTWEFTGGGGGGSGDVNGDGNRNGRDIAAFVAIIQAGGPPGDAFCAADMNQNGTVSAADVPLFVTAVLGG